MSDQAIEEVFYADGTQVVRRAVTVKLDDGTVMSMPEEKFCIAWRGTDPAILVSLLNAGWAAQTSQEMAEVSPALIQ